jgi:hypothetical protein
LISTLALYVSRSKPRFHLHAHIVAFKVIVSTEVLKIILKKFPNVFLMFLRLVFFKHDKELCGVIKALVLGLVRLVHALWVPTNA